MSIVLVSRDLVQTPPSWGLKTLIVEPYKLGLGYFTEMKRAPSEDRPALQWHQKTVCILTGLALFIPLVNTVLYIALRVLYGTADSPKAPYLTQFKEMVAQTKECSLKLESLVLRKDIGLYIDQLASDAERLLETSEISLCSEIIETLRQELLCIQQQIDFLIDAKIEEVETPAGGADSEEAKDWIRRITARSQWAPSDRAFKRLLKEGKKEGLINLKFSHFFGGTLFHHFSKLDRYCDLIAPLLAAGAELTSQDLWGNTGLIWAVANASNTTAMQIVTCAGAGAYLNVQCQMHKNTALHLAVAKGYTTHNRDGAALKHPNLELIQTFLLLGAHPNLQNSDGNTPLHLACLRRNPEMIEALLRAGAERNIANAAGHTPAEMLALDHETASEILDTTCHAYLLDKAQFEENLNTAKGVLNSYEERTEEDSNL